VFRKPSGHSSSGQSSYSKAKIDLTKLGSKGTPTSTTSRLFGGQSNSSSATNSRFGIPGSFVDKRAQETGYSPPGSSVEDFTRQRIEANKILSASGHRLQVPPPPPQYVVLQQEPQEQEVRYVYVDSSGSPVNPKGPIGQPPPDAVFAPYVSPFKYRVKHLGVDLAEGVLYTACMVFGSYLMNGLFRSLLEDNPTPRKYPQ